MNTITKTIIGGVGVLAVCYVAYSVLNPEHSAQTTQDLKVVTELSIDKLVSSLESRVGKTDVALAHYKTVHEAKRNSLIQLKALKADCERKAAECRTAIAEYKDKGNETAAATKQTELATYEGQLATLTASVEKAELAYKDFGTFLDNKRIELQALQARTSSLRQELILLNGGDARHAMEHARKVEDEIKSACSRLEAEIDVQRMDEEKM